MVRCILMWISWIIALGIISGQLIKLPIGSNGAGTLLDLAVGLLVIWGVFKIKFRILKPPFLFQILFVFIFTTLLSLIFSPLSLNPNELILSASYIIRIFLYTLLGLLIYSNVFPLLQKNIPQILLLSGISVAVLGILQFLFIPNLQFLMPNGWDPHYFRNASTFLDPNFLGGFICLTILLLISHKQLIKNQRIYFLSCLILYIALLITFSRSSYLMFFVSIFVLGLLLKSKQIIIILIATTVGLGLGFYIYTQAVSKPRNIDRRQSASFRLNTWQQGLILFEKSPILGVGYNSYRFALQKYNLATDDFTQTRGASSNDSSLLFVLATTGVIGIISYLAFILLAFKESFYKSPVLFSGLSGLLIHSIFNNSLFYPPILLWLILMIVFMYKSPESNLFGK